MRKLYNAGRKPDPRTSGALGVGEIGLHDGFDRRGALGSKHHILPLPNRHRRAFA